MQRVVIVGGGIAGLAAAHRVTELSSQTEVVLLEASPRLGGWLRTERTDGFVIEHGPDAILTQKPAAVQLAERVGLGSEMVSTRTENRGAYVVHRGKLERVPEGFALLAPVAVGPFVRTPVLSWRGKARAALDLLLPRGPPSQEESLGSFVSRRFGQEVLERLAQPLAGGIYGADPWRLSLEATMPRFPQTERAHRSVALGLWRERRRAGQRGHSSGARYGMFVSFRQGIARLPEAVSEQLERRGTRLRTGVRVLGLSRQGTGWNVRVDGESPCEADGVVIATPAPRAAELIEDVDPALAAPLAEVPHGSAATVTLAWRRDEVPHPLDASGFVVPSIEERPLLACTWSSQKWPGRAPEGWVLMRAFVGGSGREDVVEWRDEELLAVARRELRALIGVTAEPALVRIDRYVRAMPRYELGHLARVEAIESRLQQHAGLVLAGNAYRGVGIPDTVASGERAAEQLIG